jgi:hypothetical protein
VLIGRRDHFPLMRDVLILAIQLLVTSSNSSARVACDGSQLKSLLLKPQLLISNRSRRRAPPSRPEKFHLEPLTDPDVTLSRHPARATKAAAFR